MNSIARQKYWALMSGVERGSVVYDWYDSSLCVAIWSTVIINDASTVSRDCSDGSVKSTSVQRASATEHLSITASAHVVLATI